MQVEHRERGMFTAVEAFQIKIKQICSFYEASIHTKPIMAHKVNKL